MIVYSYKIKWRSINWTFNSCEISLAGHSLNSSYLKKKESIFIYIYIVKVRDNEGGMR